MAVFYEGDPKLYLEENGSYLDFRSGQPIMEKGIENAILIILFSDSDWYGNSFFSDKVGSSFLKSLEGPLTVNKIAQIEVDGIAALQPLVESSAISELNFSISVISSLQLRITILIKRPNKPISELVLLRNGVNWIFQIEKGVG